MARRMAILLAGLVVLAGFLPVASADENGKQECELETQELGRQSLNVTNAYTQNGSLEGNITIHGEIENPNEVPTKQIVEVRFKGERLKCTVVKLEGGENTTVSFNVTLSESLGDLNVPGWNYFTVQTQTRGEPAWSYITASNRTTAKRAIPVLDLHSENTRRVVSYVINLLLVLVS